MTVTLDIGIYISESMHHRVVSHSSPPKHGASAWWNEMDGDGMNEARVPEPLSLAVISNYY